MQTTTAAGGKGRMKSTIARVMPTMPKVLLLINIINCLLHIKHEEQTFAMMQKESETRAHSNVS